MWFQFSKLPIYQVVEKVSGNAQPRGNTTSTYQLAQCNSCICFLSSDRQSNCFHSRSQVQILQKAKVEQHLRVCNNYMTDQIKTYRKSVKTTNYILVFVCFLYQYEARGVLEIGLVCCFIPINYYERWCVIFQWLRIDT